LGSEGAGASAKATPAMNRLINNDRNSFFSFHVSYENLRNKP
jgi:hypothetical protein